MPISRRARTMRTAISPRLATRTFSNMRPGTLVEHPTYRSHALSVKPPFGRPARQLVAVGELQLAQHRRHVRLDGLGRDPQAQGDLLVHVPARDVTEDL